MEADLHNGTSSIQKYVPHLFGGCTKVSESSMSEVASDYPVRGFHNGSLSSNSIVS